MSISKEHRISLTDFRQRYDLLPGVSVQHLISYIDRDVAFDVLRRTRSFDRKHFLKSNATDGAIEIHEFSTEDYTWCGLVDAIDEDGVATIGAVRMQLEMQRQ